MEYILTFNTEAGKNASLTITDYETFLDTLPPEGKRKVKAYYREKYRYYMKAHPEKQYEQLEWNIQ